MTADSTIFLCLPFQPVYVLCFPVHIGPSNDISGPASPKPGSQVPYGAYSPGPLPQGCSGLLLQDPCTTGWEDALDSTHPSLLGPAAAASLETPNFPTSSWGLQLPGSGQDGKQAVRVPAHRPSPGLAGGEKNMSGWWCSSIPVQLVPCHLVSWYVLSFPL